MERRTRDAALVIRLWIEPHDPAVRARLIASHSHETVVVSGVEDILDAVRECIRGFQRQDAPSSDDRDAGATEAEAPQ